MLSTLLQPYLMREAEKPFSGEPLLFRLLHHPDLGNDPVDLACLLLHRRTLAGRKAVESVPLLSLLDNPLLLYSLGLRRTDALVMTGGLLHEWIARTKAGDTVTPENLPLAALRTREPQPDTAAPVIIALPDEKLYKSYLRQMTLSVSTLNKFLRCRLQFYYENILRVTTAEPVQFSFGKVVHTVLETLYTHRKASGNWLLPDEVQQHFEAEMEGYRPALVEAGVWDSQHLRGRQILDRYQQQMLPVAHTNVDIEYSPGRVLLDNRIPITGRIDKLEYHPDGARVVDYKTGNPEAAFKKAGGPAPHNPEGGDYWRQMVFYKVLVETATGQRGLVKAGAVEFLEREPDKQVREEFPLSEQDAQAVRGQIKEVWKKIQAGQFDTGCGRETCDWCHLVRESGIGISGA